MNGAFTVPLAFVLAVGIVGCSGDDDSDDPGDSTLAGYWVWTQQVDSGEVILTITDEDLLVADWPGCPGGIICTHYGIQKFRFDADGTVHFIHNVDTSSDYQYRGTYDRQGDLVSYAFTDHFSCAHPSESDTETRTGYFRYRIEGGNLWTSVRGFGGQLSFFDEPPESPERWVVYRPITEQDYNERYMIRVCVAPSPDDCHPGCFPEKYGSR